MPALEPEQIIAEAIERHAKGDPAALAVAIVERLWEAGYEIRLRPGLIPIRPNPTPRAGSGG
jgi:predicted trehalose synthase